MKENAIVLTVGVLDTGYAKTAHGLLRSSSRFNIVGVIDEKFQGQDAGIWVDKVERGIPVYASTDDFVARSGKVARYAVVGIALPGGKMPAVMIREIESCIRNGMSVVSGLHDFLADMPAVKALADEFGVELIDIRKPRPKHQLKFWSGEIMNVKTPIIGVLGTDCQLGKRTTACLTTESLRKKGMNAEMIFTGQTGWLQGHAYGFVLDSTYNDFISGELENAVVSCYRDRNPDVIFIEGQSALCNPSGPCGAEMLLSAQCKAVVLQHAPARIYFNGQEHTGIKISLDREMEIIRLYGSKVIALTLNTKGLDIGQARAYQKEYEEKYKLPVVLPVEDGTDRLDRIVLDYIAEFREQSALPQSV